MGLGKRLKDILKEKNITVQRLSEMTGISANTLYTIIKRDNKSIQAENLISIARALGVSVDTLIGETMYIDTVENISALLNSGEADLENLVEKIKEKNPNIPEDELLRVEQYAERLRQNEEVKNIVNLVNKEKAETERIEHLLDMLKNATPEQADKIFKLIELMLGDTKN